MNKTIFKIDTNCGFFKTKGNFSEEISRARFPNFDWDEKKLKKITWFRVLRIRINNFFKGGIKWVR